MFDRYFVSVYYETENTSYAVCDTYFKTIDSVIKFINRFNDSCMFVIHDELFPDRIIDAMELLEVWRSN